MSKRKKIECNKCRRLTWHQEIFHYNCLPLGHSEITEDTEEEWEILECLGCETITIRNTNHTAAGPRSIYYPRRAATLRNKRYFSQIPSKVHILYSQVIEAFNNNLLILCAGGIRALLEGVCKSKGVTGGPNEQGKYVYTLEGKINTLAQLLHREALKNFHSIRFLGNQALHNMEIPSRLDVEIALDLIEDVLYFVYEFEFKSQLLRKRMDSWEKKRGLDRSSAIMLAKSWINSAPVFVDIETTGLDSERDQIIEISLLNLDGKTIFYSVVRPTEPIPEFIHELTGITKEMVSKAPTFDEISHKLIEILSDQYIAGWNVQFDLRFLYSAIGGAGEKRNSYPKDAFDIAEVYSHFYGEWDSTREVYIYQALKQAANQCGMIVPNNLSARESAGLCRKIFLHIANCE
jgi:hypothetical protein